MKIELLADGDLATIQIRKLRDGRFETMVEKFEKNTGTKWCERGIMEAAQLKQLAKEALQLAGETELADQIPRTSLFTTGWRVQHISGL